MSTPAWLNSAAGALVLIGGTLTVFLMRRLSKEQARDAEILRGEHLKVRQRVKELDIDMPPGTRLPEKNERK